MILTNLKGINTQEMNKKRKDNLMKAITNKLSTESRIN